MKSRESKIQLEPERQKFITRKIPEMLCPVCNVRHDAISDVGHGEPPATDSIVICGKCGHANQINENGTLRRGHKDILSEIPPEVLKAFKITLGKNAFVEPE